MVFSYIQMMCALGSNHHELYPTDEKNVHYFAKLFTIHSTSYHSFELFECNELQEFQSLQDSHQGQILLKTNEGPIFHLPNKLPPIKSCYVNCHSYLTILAEMMQMISMSCSAPQNLLKPLVHNESPISRFALLCYILDNYILLSCSKWRVYWALIHHPPERDA